MNSNSTDEAVELLQRVFGYAAFRGKQEAVVSHVMTGGSCLVLMPTGGGKSLCFQVPALLRPGLAIVISPLIALMQDQVDALVQNGVAAAFYNSTLSFEQKRKVKAQAINGELKLLYVAPETLNALDFRAFLQSLTIGLIAVDEAHCVSQWGHDFRPEYLQIATLRQELNSNIPLIALTATADPVTQKEVRTRLGLTSDPVFCSSFDRPNIRYQIALKKSGKEQLFEFINTRHAGEAGIVYVMSRAKTEEIATWLSQKGMKALPYHAGLDQNTRRTHQERFLRDEGVVMVATIAFGMGIDKPNVRFVAHLDLPKSIESYYQETGRAGRDGDPASAWMVYGLGDVVQLRQMIESGEVGEAFKRLSQQKLNAILGFSETVRCRRQALLAYFGESYPEQCNNCDNCLEPQNTWDATLPAQKALSSIFRTGQRFGAGHLIDVLLGKETERVVQFGHVKLSVFGIGKDLKEKEWSSVFRQLAAANYLTVDPDNYGAFKLNEQSWTVLKKGQQVFQRVDPVTTKAEKKARKTPVQPTDWNDANTELFQNLRTLRLELAKEQNLPPYVVFHDSTLREMASRKPSNLSELALIPGVGEAKLKRYGQAFLEVLRT
ncbi:MAG: DNA helicase RecQ [Myxococcota bacterium]